MIVATDDARIADVARGFGAEVAMTPESSRNGTERCAAALDAIGEADIIVNLQGDAPLTPAPFVSALLEAMAADPEIEVATPGSARHARNPPPPACRPASEGRVGGTTAAIRANGDALYFSKSVIPHVAASAVGDPSLAGVPAYRRLCLSPAPRSRLMPHCRRPRSKLLEGLEQFRFIEHGRRVRVVEVAAPGYDIWELNNPEDVGPIEAAFRARGLD